MMVSLRSVLFLTSLTLVVANPCFSSHNDITAQQARDLIDSTENLIILDVREPHEYCGGHIPGAVNYPWNSGVLEERYEELINNEILVVCQSGGRSNQAANFLDSKGYTLVYDMLGGMNSWQWETSACKYAGGSGTEDNPYQIATAEDLIALGESPEDYDRHFILTADIDLDPNLPDGQVFVQAVIPKFAGVFDGNDHVIFDLKITGGSYIGLFGRLEEAKVKDLGVVDVNITSSGDYVGSLAGLSNGDVSNCYSTGTVAGNSVVGGLVGYNNEGSVTDSYSTGMVAGSSMVGGLVGCNNEGSITTSYSSGSVVGGGSYVGGLVGENDGSIISCCSSGSVTGGDRVGGLVGSNFGSITDSYCTGTVTGNSQVGGLLGHNYGNITDSYSTGEVNGDNNVGGLVGSCYSVILNSYSTGSVHGKTNVGGLVGLNIGTVAISYSNSLVVGNENVGGLVGCDIQCDQAECYYGSATLSFWDIQTSGQATSAGGEGKTTAQMMDPNTFISAGWDFVGETVNGPNDVWWILDGRDYPRLWWQLPADDFEDGKPEPLWFVYNMEPELAWLEETDGRLEINTTGSMEDVDATYVSDGWQLDANEPFAIRVDFHFSKVGVGNGRMTLGLVPTIEEPVEQWAQFEVGTFDDREFYLYEIRDGDWVREEINDRFLDDGILYISYDPDTDRLYLSDTGYGQANARWAITALVRGRWQSESIYITLGGGSEDGMALTGEDAWLDNFTVDSGAIVQ